jgi:hypothetical protein
MNLINTHHSIYQNSMNHETCGNVCISVCICLNVFVYVTNVFSTFMLYYNDLTYNSLDNYTGYQSYFIPPWWVIIFNGCIQLYMLGYNVWLISANVNSNKMIKNNINTIAGLLFTHNLLRTIEYMSYIINYSGIKDINNIILQIMVVIFSVSILGIDISMMTKLRTFHYGDAKIKTCLFDLPITALFSWSIIDFIIQLNNILNVYNWGYNTDIYAYYVFMLWLYVTFSIILVSFRNMFTYVFYIVVLIGYGAKFYEFYEFNSYDIEHTNIATCVNIFISLFTLFGYMIYYSNMNTKYKKKHNQYLKPPLITYNNNNDNDYYNEQYIMGRYLDDI